MMPSVTNIDTHSYGKYMTDLICPFSAPLVKKDFACSNAQEIIRRGGAEIACQQLPAHSVCQALHNSIKAASLSAMDLEDDLLSLPHNILLKIQYGGLLGLRDVTQGDTNQGDVQSSQGIDDVAALVSAASAKFSSLENIPMQPVCETVIDYKVQRRRKK